MDNYTKFPNDILEAVIAGRFSAIQLTVIMYVVRKVNGWGKPSDSVSVSKMASASSYTRRAMVNAVNDLEKMGVLMVERNGVGRVSEMRILDPEKWDKPVNGGSHVNSGSHVNAHSHPPVNGGSHLPVNGHSQEPVNGGSHTKERKIIKEKIKKGNSPYFLEEKDDLEPDDEYDTEGWKVP